MRFSLCVCTRNRARDLERCLKSINQSEHPVHQVIVADDSTNDDTRLLVAERFPEVTFVEGPRLGLSANRNRALREVLGDLVIFLDDDAVLSPVFVSNSVDALLQRRDSAANIILTGYELNHGREIRSNNVDYLGFQSRVYLPNQPLDTIVINSAVIPAKLAKRIGFDEFLIYGSDEVDFAMRARAEGAQIVFCPGLKNEHFPSEVNRTYYTPFADASRIYVTFKRYWILERRSSKALLYLVIASLHLLCANIKRLGLKSVLLTIRSLFNAYRYILKSFARSSHAHLDAGT